ncbi:hypothetical protein G9A89_008960 [Geosiphon pyriformis]|nr:hypothetical protein G9A89_008960 [Geosiphon pyriformis]
MNYWIKIYALKTLFRRSHQKQKGTLSLMTIASFLIFFIIIHFMRAIWKNTSYHQFRHDKVSEVVFPTSFIANSSTYFSKKASLPDGDRKYLITVEDDDETLYLLKKFAYYAHIAYCLEESTDGVGFGIMVSVLIQIFPDQKVDLVVYFRANDLTRAEWLDREFELIDHPKFPNSKIDKIFYNQFKAVEEAIQLKIIDKIAPLKAPNLIKRATFVGHSIAGAYAVLSAAEWARELIPTPFFVYTYGAPRIGDRNLATTINRIPNLYVLRVTHTDDYVPRLPLRGTEMPFIHSGCEHWIFINCECENAEEVYLCLGPIERGLLIESQQCNNKYTYLGDFSHKGPYFNYVMGECPNPLPLAPL